MQLPLIDKDHYGKIAERLRIRLDLATFKCKHGYQNIDLYTIESFLSTTARTTTRIACKKSSALPAKQYTSRRRSMMNQHQHQQHQHQKKHHYPRYYPTHQDNRKKESFSKTTRHHQQQPQPQPSSPPLSAKRSTSPSRTDELTARLLLWMCHQKRTTDCA